MNINNLVERFESSINGLKKVFFENDNNFFFTEKELHSYFYHLCLQNEFIFNKYNLIHTEYPTPFKCKNIKDEPYIEMTNKDSKDLRGHIDLVLINPNFIDFSFQQNKVKSENIIMGLGHFLFSKYIDTFYEVYNEFGNKYNESILLYSLEFKYIRHTAVGEKYPAIEIKRDINKLKLLENFQIFKDIPFSKYNKSLVFIGNRISENTIRSINNVKNENSNYCELFKK